MKGAQRCSLITSSRSVIASQASFLDRFELVNCLLEGIATPSQAASCIQSEQVRVTLNILRDIANNYLNDVTMLMQAAGGECAASFTTATKAQAAAAQQDAEGMRAGEEDNSAAAGPASSSSESDVPETPAATRSSVFGHRGVFDSCVKLLTNKRSDRQQ